MKLKTILFLVLLFSILNNSLNAQLSPTFKLSDTTVYQGQKHILSGLVTNFRGNFQKESSEKLDSIIDFLKSNPEITLEIGVHTDQRGKSYPNYELSKRRADALKNDICSKGGIDKNRIIAIGNGEDFPIISLDSILKFSKDDRESLYIQNRRIELQILEGKDYRTELRKNIYFSTKFNFDDLFIENNQTKIIEGIICTIEGEILKDSLNQLDSLILLLKNDTSITISFYHETEDIGELTYDYHYERIEMKREIFFKNYISKKGNINPERIIIIESYLDTTYPSSIDSILLKKEWSWYEEYFNRKKSISFNVKIESCGFSELKEKEFYDDQKLNVIKKITEYLSDSSWNQYVECGLYSFYNKEFNAISIELYKGESEIERFENEGIGVFGIDINIYERRNLDLLYLYYEESEFNPIFTKSNVVFIHYYESSDTEYNKRIELIISEIEQFFKDNYENL